MPDTDPHEAKTLDLAYRMCIGQIGRRFDNYSSRIVR